MRQASNPIIRNESGQILALVAISSVVVLMFAALVIDVGNWFSHKRQLQNRADAGALASGSEWARNFPLCAQGGITADTAGKSISRIAQQFAGSPTADPGPSGTGYDPTVTPPVNIETANQSNVEVFINSTSDDATVSDGGGPCFKHSSDAISPNGGYWVDVRVKERNLNSFFGSIGIPLTRNIARARVELRQVNSVTKGLLPFVGETADVAPCAWVQFVRDDSDRASGDAVGPLTLLQGTGPRTYATASDIVFTMPGYNISARITVGASTNGTCLFSTPNKVSFEVPEKKNDPILGLAYLHSGSNVSPRTATQNPVARSISINNGSCSEPYFVRSGTSCNVGVQAVIDFGDSSPVTNLGASVTASDGGAPVTLNYVGAGLWTSATSFAVAPGTGRKELTLSWSRTKGTIAGTNCATASCSGDFGAFSQMVYAADDNSGPVATLNVLDSSGVNQPGSAMAGADVSLKLNLVLSSFDPAQLVLIRGSVKGTDNRTSAVDCGYRTGSDALRDAITLGCPPVPGPPTGYQINNRRDTNGVRTFACTNPNFDTLQLWDCLNEQPTTGNRTGPVEQAMQDRFGCTPNNFPNPYPAGGWTPDPNDRRISTIFLTTYGVLKGSGDLPIVGWVTVYVRGFHRGSGPQCVFDSAPPPNADRQGTEIWGHYINFTDASGNSQPGPTGCDLSVQGLLCAPALVR